MSLHALILLFLLGTNNDLLGRRSSVSGGKFTLALDMGSDGDCSLLGSISYVQQTPPILELLLLSRLSSVWGATVLAPSEPELLELRRSMVDVEVALLRGLRNGCRYHYYSIFFSGQRFTTCILFS